MKLNPTVVDVIQNFLINPSCSIIFEHFIGNKFQKIDHKDIVGKIN